MGKYKISKRKKQVVVKIQLADIQNDRPNVFGDELEAIFDKYKGQNILVDVSQLPAYGDFTKTRMWYLLGLTAAKPKLRIKSSELVYDYMFGQLPENLKGTADGYRLCPTPRPKK